MAGIMDMLAQLAPASQAHQLQQIGQPQVVLDDEHFANNYNTKLAAKEEAQFQAWAQANNKLGDIADYDMRGAWKSGAAQADNGHFPDTFKKPNHPTFSDQSQYHGATNPNGGQFIGGNWEDAPGGKSMYTPSAEMVRQPGYVTFMQNDYFPKVEPGNIFNMDRKTPQRKPK